MYNTRGVSARYVKMHAARTKFGASNSEQRFPPLKSRFKILYLMKSEPRVIALSPGWRGLIVTTA
jgi:hypothetical protein